MFLPEACSDPDLKKQGQVQQMSQAGSSEEKNKTMFIGL